MSAAPPDSQNSDPSEPDIQRHLSLFAELRKEEGEEKIVQMTLNRMRAAEGGDDEEQEFEDREQVKHLLSRYGDDYRNDLVVALYYEGAARRAEQLGGEYEARIPGITSVVEQLRRGLNQPSRAGPTSSRRRART